MLRNNKGFTVVELIASFVFTSVLAITLFAAVQNYKDKQADSVIASELLAFKSQLLIDIEKDIQTKGLYEIEYANCSAAAIGSEGSTIVTIVPRCVDLKFNDGTSKRLLVSRKSKVDELLNEDGTRANFNITYAYISYGGVQYRIPDEDNVDLATDYFFEQSEPYDGLETNTPLYKVRIDLVHKDLTSNIVISFVAVGSKYISSSSAPYVDYKIGDKVTVKVTNSETRKFRVIQDSSGYEDSVTLLYDDDYDSTVVLDQVAFNDNIASGNSYVGSGIENAIKYFKNGVTGAWTNAKEARLITEKEVEYVSSTCINRTNLSLSSAPDWLTNVSYWTMSASDAGNGYAWYVNGTSKQLASSQVNSKYALRPVIVIEKQYITHVDSY